MSSPWPRSVALAPLGHLAEIQLGKMLQPTPSDGDREYPYLRAGSLANLASLSELPTMFGSSQDAERYGVRRGDLLVAEGGDCGQSRFAPEVPEGTIIQNSLHRLRARDGADLRFIQYCLEAIYGSHWLEVLCNKSTFGHLTREKLASMRVPALPLDEQRAIADYLDRETARIDALIAAKEQMRALARERVARAFDDVVAGFGARPPSAVDEPWELPSGWLTANLSQVLVQLTNGYVGPTRDILVDEGIRYIQSLHIKDGKIDFGRAHYFVTPEWHDERPRIHLREGDVLIVQTGDIGQVAVVPRAFGEASCHALQIARVNRSLVSGEYLAAYLRSPFGQASLLSRATGALHPHLEAGIKTVPVAVPPPAVQREIVAAVRTAEERTAHIDVALARQAGLLREHRQALVTKAVTGHIEVPVVA